MAWTYDPTLATPKDETRIKIGDTVQEDPLFSDEEIVATLTRNANDVLKASIELMRSLVRRHARLSGTLRADDVSKNVGSLYKQYQEQLNDLLLEASAISGTTMSGQLGGALPSIAKFRC